MRWPEDGIKNTETRCHCKIPISCIIECSRRNKLFVLLGVLKRNGRSSIKNKRMYDLTVCRLAGYFTTASTGDFTYHTWLGNTTVGQLEK